MGSVHSLVDIFRGPVKIILFLYHTSTLSWWNTTVHPALHNSCIPKSDAMARFGTMCPVRGRGKPGINTSQVCVDLTWRPSGRFTVSSLVAGCMIWHGVPSLMNIDIAPVSAMPCVLSIPMSRWQGVKLASSTCMRVVDTFDVTSVASLSMSTLPA